MSVIPPPPPPPPVSDNEMEEQLFGGASESLTAEDLVPPESPRFLPFLLSLDPYTFWLVSILIAVFIAKEAKYPDEQDAIGTFLESVGSNIEFIAAQGLYLQVLKDRRKEKVVDIEKEQLKKELDDIKKTMAEMQSLLIACCPDASEKLSSIKKNQPSNSNIQSETYQCPPQ